MKKFLAGVVMAVMMVTAVVGLAACDSTQVSTKYSYVSLKINPEVDFVVDESGKVASYYCVNEDAEVLLGDVDLSGQSIEEATENVLDMAVDAGYVDVETTGDKIEVGVIDENGKEDAETFEKLEKNLNQYFENKGVFGKVSKVALDTYLAQAQEMGISVGHVKILMLACDRSGLTLDELKDKPMNELMKIIHEKNDKKLKEKDNAKKQEHKLAKEEKIEQNAQKLQEHKNQFEKNKENKEALVKNWQQKKVNA